MFFPPATLTSYPSLESWRFRIEANTTLSSTIRTRTPPFPPAEEAEVTSSRRGLLVAAVEGSDPTRTAESGATTGTASSGQGRIIPNVAPRPSPFCTKKHKKVRTEFSTTRKNKPQIDQTSGRASSLRDPWLWPSPARNCLPFSFSAPTA